MRSFSFMLCACVSLDVADEAMDLAMKAIPESKAVSVATLSEFDFTSVCVLLPDQDKLNPGNAEADRVNVHLRGMRYASDDSHWALVLINRSEIEVVSFNRSEQLDIIGRVEIGQSAHLQQEKLPPGFVPSDCADNTRAELTRFKHRDRSYIILGETP